MNKTRERGNDKAVSSLVERIYSEFYFHSEIDLRVLVSDDLGRSLFKGPPDALSATFLDPVLTEPGTYYMFKVYASNGMPGDAADPTLFAWITAPRPPRPVFVSPTAMKLRWSPLQLYGEYNTELLLNATYALEAAEGTEFRPGVASKYRTDIAANDYKVLARGHALTDATVTDLKAGNWYNWRVTIGYAGARFTSDYRSIATQQGPPPVPLTPTLIVKTSQTPGLFKRENKTTALKFAWKEQPFVQPEIKKHQVQIEERCRAHMSAHSGGGSAAESCGCRPWRTVCSDVHTYFKCRPPAFGSAEWRVRVRSWNAHGWSAFSKPLVISYKSHSELFPAGFLAEKKNSEDEQLYIDDVTTDYYQDEFEGEEGVTTPTKYSTTPVKLQISVAAAGSDAAGDPEDVKEIKNLCLDFHLNEEMAAKELAPFLSKFPPRYRPEEGDKVPPFL